MSHQNAKKNDLFLQYFELSSSGYFRWHNNHCVIIDKNTSALDMQECPDATDENDFKWNLHDVRNHFLEL